MIVEIVKEVRVPDELAQVFASGATRVWAGPNNQFEGYAVRVQKFLESHGSLVFFPNARPEEI